MNIKKKNALFGRYPSCDRLNNALRFILKGEHYLACEQIVYAIQEAGGYFHEDVAPIVGAVTNHDWGKLYYEGR